MGFFGKWQNQDHIVGHTSIVPLANSDIPILKNDALNKYLSSLADLLMPSIVAANESVAIQIAQVFDFVIWTSPIVSYEYSLIIGY